MNLCIDERQYREVYAKFNLGDRKMENNVVEMPSSGLVFKELNDERSRTYYFPIGPPMKFENVQRLCVRPSGTHRLELADGAKVIVPAGFRAIVVDAEEWSC